MGKIKELMMDRMSVAGLNEAQEEEVFTLLTSLEEDKSHVFSTLQERIDWAIMQVKWHAPIVKQEHNEEYTSHQDMVLRLELDNRKLIEALSKVLNFELGSWKAAQHLLDVLNKGEK